MVRSVLGGRKVVGREIRAEFGDEDTCEVIEVATEGGGFPTTRVLMEAEAVLVPGKRRQAGDGFLVGMNVEEAALGLGGDVCVVAEGVDGGGEPRGLIGSAVGTGRTFGGLHVRLRLRATGGLVLGLQGIAAEAPPEGVGSFAVPVVYEAEERRAQLGQGMEVSVPQALPVHDAEEHLDLVDPGRVLGRVVEDEASAVAGVNRDQRRVGPS